MTCIKKKFERFSLTIITNIITITITITISITIAIIITISITISISITITIIIIFWPSNLFLMLIYFFLMPGRQDSNFFLIFRIKFLFDA